MSDTPKLTEDRIAHLQCVAVTTDLFANVDKVLGGDLRGLLLDRADLQLDRDRLQRELSEAQAKAERLREDRDTLLTALRLASEACRIVHHDSKMHGVLTEWTIDRCQQAFNESRAAIKSVEVPNAE